MYKKSNYLLKIIICIFLFLIFYIFLLNFNENFTGKNNEIEIVVSRYNESMDWLNNYPFNKYDITIYNKGLNYGFPKNEKIKRILNINNLGRESHTYLYHIIQNYDVLANVTVFLPGSCEREDKYYSALNTIHKVEETKNTVFNSITNDVYTDFKDFLIDEYQSTSNENKSINDENKLKLSQYRPFGEWFKHYFGDINVKNISYFGIFAVHKNHILQHPKSYYENLIKELEESSNPEAGHFFERAWGAVFYPTE